MAPVKRVDTTRGRSTRGIAIGRVSKSSYEGKPKARKLMKKLYWYDVEETSDLDGDLSDDEDITNDVDVHNSVANQSQLKQEPIVKKRKFEEDDIKLYDIPQWPGHTLQGDEKRYETGRHREIKMKDIPRWPGNALRGEHKGHKAEEHREIKLEEIPQYPYNFDHGSIPAEMPAPIRGISPIISDPGHGSLNYPGLDDWDQHHPPIQSHYYDPYYHDLLVEKKQLLLEMQRVMGIQARIDAMSATIELERIKLDAAVADNEEKSYLWWPRHF